MLNRKKAVDGATPAASENAKIEDSLADDWKVLTLRCATGMPTDMAGPAQHKSSANLESFLPGRFERGIGSIAFVFGNERMGLAEEDMAICDVVLGIPRTPTLGRSTWRRPSSWSPTIGGRRWAGFPREADRRRRKPRDARPRAPLRDGPRRSRRQRGRHARRCGGPIAVRHQGLLGRHVPRPRGL